MIFLRTLARGARYDAYFATFDHMRTAYCVQVKFHSGVTDDWAVQQIRDFAAQKDRMDDGYTKIGWVVTFAPSFSAECVQLAKEHSIGLFTGTDLARMILESGIKVHMRTET